jgi:carbon-monoxide dehydrogenase catalytic subunit
MITTMPIAKIPNAVHIEFSEEKAMETGKQIINEAIEAFKKRDPNKVDIPDISTTAITGFACLPGATRSRLHKTKITYKW